MTVLLFLSACDTTSVEPEDSDLLPLIRFEVGTTWVLDRVLTNRAGEQTQFATDTLRVVDLFSYQDEEWIELAGSSSPLSIVRGFYVLRDDGYHRSYSDPREGLDESFLYLRYPAAIGDAYDLPGAEEPASFAFGPIAIRVTDLADPVETGLGTIPTIRYTFEPGIAYYQYEPYEIIDASFDVRMAAERGFVQFESVYVGFAETHFERAQLMTWTLAETFVGDVPAHRQQRDHEATPGSILASPDGI